MSLWLEDTDTGEWETLWYPAKSCGSLSLYYRMAVSAHEWHTHREYGRGNLLASLLHTGAAEFSAQLMAAYEADDYRIFNKAIAEDEMIWGDGWPSNMIQAEFTGEEPTRPPGMRHLQPVRMQAERNGRGWTRDTQTYRWVCTVEFYANLQMTPARWIPTANKLYRLMEACVVPTIGEMMR
jgi:hypothetical protein